MSEPGGAWAELRHLIIRRLAAGWISDPVRPCLGSVPDSRMQAHTSFATLTTLGLSPDHRGAGAALAWRQFCVDWRARRVAHSPLGGLRMAASSMSQLLTFIFPPSFGAFFQTRHRSHLKRPLFFPFASCSVAGCTCICCISSVSGSDWASPCSPGASGGWFRGGDTAISRLQR